ncbi:AMP-dependent synthetase/ligase [Patulibacter defluvii]|uniref:AMP-dependent synthetase/ligase n=1 Tax=Patulibacter defluvii TaxID=3095358 RepID=UPI002A757867|nr:AMP-dependent synthetase/ligase [Patulibacter sp. DM4]
MATTATPRRVDVVEADPTATTLPAAFQATAAAHADRIALRDADGTVELTFGEYARRVERIARGLHALGVRHGDTVAILLVNRPEFHLVDSAAFHLGAVPFSIYQTLAPEQIAHLYANAGCDVVVTEAAFLDRARAAAAGRERPTTFVTVDGPAADAIDLDELERRPSPGFDFEATWRAVRPEDVLTLIYTSGTTGPSKGVQLTHANVVFSVRAIASVLEIRPGDRITSYLPSAHAADRWSSHYNNAMLGTQVTCVDDLRRIAQVLPALRPTIWGGVPRVVEKLKAALEAGIAGEPDEQRRAALEGAIAVGREKVRLEQAGEPVPPELAARHAALDEAVLSRLRAKLGLDQVRWIVIGAAPLSRDVHEFLLAIGLPVIELYGMSEATVLITAVAPDAGRIGTVGRAAPGVELRVADDGELFVRGPIVMAGYRGEPGKTAEAIDADGWLATGDVVSIDDDGHVAIVDRKKEIIINAAGKNMSPANIEQELKAASPLIGQAAVIGNDRRYNVALLVLDPDMAAAHAARHGLPDGSVAAVAADPGVRAAVAEAVERANARLARVEQIKRHLLLADEWLPGGDELTPTMKLKRKPIDAKYAEAIERLYGE